MPCCAGSRGCRPGFCTGNPPAPAPRRTISMACPPSRRLARPRSTGATLRATLAPGPRRRSRPAKSPPGHMRGDSGPLRKPSPAVRALAPGFECVSDSFPNRDVRACRGVRPCSCIEYPHWKLTCVLSACSRRKLTFIGPSPPQCSKPRADMEQTGGPAQSNSEGRSRIRKPDLPPRKRPNSRAQLPARACLSTRPGGLHGWGPLERLGRISLVFVAVVGGHLDRGHVLRLVGRFVH